VRLEFGRFEYARRTRTRTRTRTRKFLPHKKLVLLPIEQHSSFEYECECRFAECEYDASLSYQFFSMFQLEITSVS
jgi:hypothetical protein